MRFNLKTGNGAKITSNHYYKIEISQSKDKFTNTFNFKKIQTDKLIK